MTNSPRESLSSQFKTYNIIDYQSEVISQFLLVILESGQSILYLEEKSPCNLQLPCTQTSHSNMSFLDLSDEEKTERRLIKKK